MSVENRIESLKDKHEQLEKKLHAEEVRPAPDEVIIAQVKKEKLSLKDEIIRLEEEG